MASGQCAQWFCGFTLMMLWIRLVTALLLSPIALAQELPPGTVVPIELSSGLNAKKDEAGKRIEGRVMQEVPVPAGDKINERSRISGHVVRVTKPGTSGSSIVLRFDAIEDGGRTIPLTAALLAVASMDSVADAQTPLNSTSDRDPVSQWVTRQVGGDVINRGRGTAGSTRGVVGKWVRGSSVMIKLTPNPDLGCPSGTGYDREQAVWIFSSAACGTYGLRDVKIANSGGTSPLGEVALRSDKNISIRGGSGWLLIVVASD